MNHLPLTENLTGADKNLPRVVLDPSSWPWGLFVHLFVFGFRFFYRHIVAHNHATIFTFVPWHVPAIQKASHLHA